ncbi:MAG: aminodeoxychorismate/anthranilate synthase component II [Bacteroidetes bacterium]|nr:aminodeoxychorismate/anthranilate synthase component II [Bacteroidota bacterium]MBK8659226.1 aminodeoxychorismate/anthranilate synthase component II [Bacteroidota bacterium]
MVLLLDNYDSFTYNLRDYVLQCGCECMVIRNDEKTLQQISTLPFKALILSPGPKTPNEAGVTMELIEKYHTRIPILGICLGHQALGLFFGASLEKALQPMHGKTSLISTQSHPIFRYLPAQFQVMRYHSLILKKLENTPLRVIAQTQQGEIMGIAHETLPLTGLQFHPESILTEHGLSMIQNWVDTINGCR